MVGGRRYDITVSMTDLDIETYTYDDSFHEEIAKAYARIFRLIDEGSRAGVIHMDRVGVNYEVKLSEHS